MRVIVDAPARSSFASGLVIFGVQRLGGAMAQTAIQLEAGLSAEISGFAVDGHVSAELGFRGKRLPFEFTGVEDDDVLAISIESHTSLRLKVHHLRRPTGPCSAKCWDGRVGQPCVDCHRDGIDFRICC